VLEVRISLTIDYLQGRSGEIKHLYRNFAFLHSRMYLDNGGIFVCKTRHLQLAGGAKVRHVLISNFSLVQ
jgi:transcription elongation factor SPT5